jgi:hypothetical protein
VKTTLGQSVASLSPKRRVGYYRAAAAEALKLSDGITDPTLRTAYVELASGWHDLAAEIENSLRVSGETGDSDSQTTISQRTTY